MTDRSSTPGSDEAAVRLARFILMSHQSGDRYESDAMLTIAKALIARSEIAPSVEQCASICEAKADAWDASVAEGSESPGYEADVLREAARQIRAIRTQSANTPMMVGGFCTDREGCVADRDLLARAYALLWDGDGGTDGVDIATDIAATLKQPHTMILDRATKNAADRSIDK